MVVGKWKGKRIKQQSETKKQLLNSITKLVFWSKLYIYQQATYYPVHFYILVWPSIMRLHRQRLRRQKLAKNTLDIKSVVFNYNLSTLPHPGRHCSPTELQCLLLDLCRSPSCLCRSIQKAGIAHNELEHYAKHCRNMKKRKERKLIGKTEESIRLGEAFMGRSGQHETNGIKFVVDSSAFDHVCYDVTKFRTISTSLWLLLYSLITLWVYSHGLVNTLSFWIFCMELRLKQDFNWTMSYT